MEQRLTGTLIPAGYKQLRAVKARRWELTWKRRLAPAMLILSDVLLALLVWEVASVVQGLWGRGELSELAAATVAPVVVVWVGLRTLLGLYQGYGLDSVEELRRHTYAVFAALAILAVFAVGFQVGNSLSRLLLLFAFLGLLFLPPPLRATLREVDDKRDGNVGQAGSRLEL